MFARTHVKPVIPEREDMDLDQALCPPHEFDAAWALAADATDHDDTVPALYCRACGEIRSFRLMD